MVAAKPSYNRGDAAEGWHHPLKKDGTYSKTLQSKPVLSDLMGYYDEPVCRVTEYTAKDMKYWHRVLPYVQAVDAVFKRLMPDRHKAQMRMVKETPSQYRILDTAFSTITANLDFRTTVHKDKGDLKEGFGVMAAMGKCSGGYLCFPKFGIAVDMRFRDLLLADVHEYHGNTPIIGLGKHHRISTVFYYRTNMRYCGDVDSKTHKHAVHFSSKSVEWGTPPEMFDFWDQEFGFNLDACATPDNAKCRSYFTRQENGLRQRWTGRIWCNPPYGREIGLWVRKAWESVKRGDAELVVLLVPARTDTAWWHDYCMRGEIRFLQGRVQFVGATHGAPFPSAVIVFRR
jgi:phage N-6-adenine-methyltransferase